MIRVKLTLILMVLALLSPYVFGGDVYVATDGNDSDKGRIDSPFRTIERAVSELDPGETCYIRGGTYHEEVGINNLDGTSSSPITFTNYNGEEVIIDGTEPVSSGWTVHSGDIYKTTLSQDVWQLFVSGEQMIPARWPNATFDELKIWDRYQWAHANGALTTLTDITDLPQPGSDLAASGIDITGAMAVLNINLWKTYTRAVTSHTAGSDTFTHNAADAFAGTEHYYFVDSALSLLDAEKEWFYDKNTNELYLWAPGGGVPSDVHGKTMTYAFDISWSSYINIRGLDFFGSTFHFYESTNMTVEDCDFKYPASSKRMLGDEGTPQTTFLEMSSLLDISNNLVLNCTFDWTDCAGIEVKGCQNTIENCYFRNIDWTGGSQGKNLGVSLWIDGIDNVIRRVTMHRTGASSGVQSAERQIVELCNFYDTGYGQNDGSTVQVMRPDQLDTHLRYNWLHDTIKKGLRFDTANDGVFGVGGNIYYNVAFNNGSNGIQEKGDEHTMYNNLGFGNEACDILVGKDFADENANTITRNNIADFLSSDRTAYAALPGTVSNNWNGWLEGQTTVKAQLRDPDNLDFRPKAGSDIIDAGYVISGITDGYLGSAPDIGPYEYGDTNYWIAGYKTEKASIPVPPDNAVVVKTDADLMWLEGYKATSHNVYLGTDPGSLVFKGNQTNNIYDPGDLAADTVYYWRIDAVTPGGTITGDVWSLDTSEGPTLPLPAYDDFEAGWGNYTPGGEDAYLDTVYPYEGLQCAAIQDNSRNSYFETTLNIDATPYTHLRVDFTFKMISMDPGEDWWLQYYNGITWETVAVFSRDTYLNGIYYTESVIIDGAIYDMVSNAKIRFLCDATGDADDTYVDAITITGIDGSSNQAPTFSNDPINEIDAAEDSAYSSTIADDASDPDSDPLTFSKVDGPAWLTVASNGDLSGTPGNDDVGENTFTVRVEDALGLSDQAELNISVYGSPDINGNGNFDLEDLGVIAGNWQNACEAPTWCDGADLDISGTVDIADMGTFAARWLD